MAHREHEFGKLEKHRTLSDFSKWESRFYEWVMTYQADYLQEVHLRFDLE